jgi:glycosyltransferase involved in cell wall biosynthesis
MLVGYGPEETRLKALVKTLQLDAQVSFPGPTNTPENWYKSFDVMCLPSMVEGFGLTVVEALAAGVPVVGVHSAALDLIFPPAAQKLPGPAGFLTDGNDPETLTTAIHQVIADPTLHSNESVRLRLGLAAPFAEEKMLASYNDFLEKIISS